MRSRTRSGSTSWTNSPSSGSSEAGRPGDPVGDAIAHGSAALHLALSGNQRADIAIHDAGERGGIGLRHGDSQGMGCGKLGRGTPAKVTEHTSAGEYIPQRAIPRKEEQMADSGSGALKPRGSSQERHSLPVQPGANAEGTDTSDEQPAAAREQALKRVGKTNKHSSGELP